MDVISNPTPVIHQVLDIDLWQLFLVHWNWVWVLVVLAILRPKQWN